MAEEHDAAILRVKRFLSDCGLAVTWGEARGAVQAARASPPEPDALKLAEAGRAYWEVWREEWLKAGKAPAQLPSWDELDEQARSTTIRGIATAIRAAREGS
jgi:hypothetical protein